MRRLVLAATAVAAVAALSAPALAAPPVPVPTVTKTDQGVCVSAFTWVPQCVPTDFIK